MKNETKQNDSQVIKQKLPTRDPRQQKESEGINPDAGRRTALKLKALMEEGLTNSQILEQYFGRHD